MPRLFTIVRGCFAAALLVIAGCGPSYHSYADCQVPCKYCAPTPLPYTHYHGCTCHACVAEPYLVATPSSVDDQTNPIAGSAPEVLP